MFQATIWSILPPVIAIGLALVTKEVYSSLFVGILAGALMFTGFQPMPALETIFNIIGDKVGGNASIIAFLVFLGILVALMNKSGATTAYGNWVAKKISSKRGSLAATSALGVLIFVDDYFNCLTVGTVMSPVTDKAGISRAKLAYIIDATAAPVCIIAPISSWAAAVSSSLPEGSTIDGFNLFLRTIPYNLYAILTLAMIVFLIATNFDFGAMKKYEELHANDELKEIKSDHLKENANGKICDLIIPLAGLIFFCIMAMLYTGGMFSGEGISIITAFSDCSASLSLAMGGFLALVLTLVWYLPRKVISFTEFTDSFTEGFKAMVPAILILTLAWTISGICDADFLNVGGFVGNLVENNPVALGIMPAIFFLIALGLAFATGTSWGTFGILVPIVVTVFGADSELMVITVAAVLSGAVCGDHVSPISDTTILSSTGAGCNHIDHVNTQMPYALLVAGVCFVSYLVGGLLNNGWIGLLVGFVVLMAILFGIFAMSKKSKAKV